MRTPVWRTTMCISRAIAVGRMPTYRCQQPTFQERGGFPAQRQCPARTPVKIGGLAIQHRRLRLRAAPAMPPLFPRAVGRPFAGATSRRLAARPEIDHRILRRREWAGIEAVAAADVTNLSKQHEGNRLSDRCIHTPPAGWARGMHAGHRNRVLTGLAVILQGTSFSFLRAVTQALQPMLRPGIYKGISCAPGLYPLTPP